MSARSKKATFNLSIDVLAAIDDAVAQGAASSKNAFVEQAICKELDSIRRRNRQDRWEEASRDPLFLRDIEGVAREFEAADIETAEAIV